MFWCFLAEFFVRINYAVVWQTVLWPFMTQKAPEMIFTVYHIECYTSGGYVCGTPQTNDRGRNVKPVVALVASANERPVKRIGRVIEPFPGVLSGTYVTRDTSKKGVLRPNWLIDWSSRILNVQCHRSRMSKAVNWCLGKTCSNMLFHIHFIVEHI